MYHPGHLEARHEFSNDSWTEGRRHPLKYSFATRFYTKDMYKAIKNNDFIPCGDSGGRLYACEGVHLGRPSIGSEGPQYTCCFIFGRSCSDMIFERRWSCCKASTTGTIDEAQAISGCSFVCNEEDLGEIVETFRRRYLRPAGPE